MGVWVRGQGFQSLLEVGFLMYLRVGIFFFPGAKGTMMSLQGGNHEKHSR